MVRPPCTCFTSLSASNFPEHIRIKAIRSRWALFIFACILNTKAEKSFSTGSISSPSLFLGSGVVVILRKCFKKISTPKFVSADPKNTGVSFPSLTFSSSKAAPAISISSMSSLSFSYAASPISAITPASFPSQGICLSSPSLVPFWVSE